MQTNVNSLWWPRGVTFVVSALVALSATFWVLKSNGPSSSASALAAMAGGNNPPMIDTQIVAMALGGGKQAATPEAAPISSRYALTGVVADLSKAGAALISVDGKPPKAFRVGSTVDGNLLLQSVSGRRAVLAADAQGNGAVTLELPSLIK
jgi:general secretion pathway protein C